MARKPEGWRLICQGGWWYVRYRHEGRRPKIPCGTQDLGEAQKLAPQRYAEAIAGKRQARRLTARSTAPLDELVALWLASLEAPGGLSARSRRSYLDYAKAQWLPRWERLGQVTEPALKVYVRERLGQVTRSTVRKEVSGLRGLLAWCRDQELLDAVPTITLPRRAPGTRRAARRVPVPLSVAEVRGLLACLPERAPRSRKGDRGGLPFPVQAYAEFLWETGLRPATVAALRVPSSWSPGADALELADEDDKARWGRRVPLSQRALQLLQEHAPSSGPIWGRYKIGAYLRAAARASGLPADRAARVCAYDLRHARITALALLETGAADLCAPAPRLCAFGPADGPSCPGEGPRAVVPGRSVCSQIRLRGAQGGT